MPFQVLKNFSVENLETTPSTFHVKLCSDIYLSRIIKYWGSTFTLYLTWGALSLVCVLSVFFFFFPLSFSLLFFFFYRYFLYQTLTIHWISGKGEGIIIFLVSHFYLFMNIHLVLRDFYHFFLIDLFVITRLIANDTYST